MKKLKGLLIAGFLFFGLWVLAAGINTEEIIISIVAIFLILIFFHQKFSIFEDVNLSPKSLFFMILYGFVFLWELIKSNLDVAFRVLKPALPINPGIVKVKVKLKSKLGREFLANSITLTPGTLTVETKDEFFYIHWIDVSAQNIEESTKAIVSNFEKYLEVIFG